MNRSPAKWTFPGKLELTGSEEHPVQVKMSHHFANVHHQTMKVDPLDHHLKVATRLSEPIHHALQMRTPLRIAILQSVAHHLELRLRF